MADETEPAIGMSVGATTLAAVTADRAVTRRPVLTLYPDRSPQIGMPGESPELSPGPGESGLMITDFVDQVGAPGPVLASDGSAHRGEQLLADGLRALAFVAAENRPMPTAVAVTHPAHWTANAVAALRSALSRVPEWSQHSVLLLPDVAAALTALQVNPGLPTDGVIAVCDFGGSGSSLTLVDAANGYQPLDTTMRYTGLSGDLIDQALLDQVVANLSAEGTLDGTSTIGSPARLRSQCRDAKENLSANTVTELTVDVPGFHGGVWVTRAELDEAIRQPLDGFLTKVAKALERNKLQATTLAAVVAVGGGANIPAINAGLSRRLGVSVISSPRPQLTPAIGAALRVSGNATGTTVTTASAPTPPATPPQLAPPQPAPPDLAPPPTFAPAPTPTPIPSAPDITAPPGGIEYPRFPAETGPTPRRWYRRPTPLLLLTAAVVLALGILAVIALRHAADTQPVPRPTVTSTSAVPPPALPTQFVPPPPPPPPAWVPMPSEEPADTESPTLSSAQEIPEGPTP